ncbi:hypothetical protein D9M68_940200 [compost metagenome]
MARKRDKTLIKFLVALLLFFVAAHGGTLMVNAEPASVSLNCVATQNMQADTQPMAICPDIQSQIACSISCATPYAGVMTVSAASPLVLVSPQHDGYTPCLGRMAVAPEPFPPKFSALS